MEPNTSNTSSPAARAIKERIEKWRENIRLEMIRARAYEPDEILIRTQDRS